MRSTVGAGTSNGRSGFTIEALDEARRRAAHPGDPASCATTPRSSWRRSPAAPHRAHLFRPHRGADPAPCQSGRGPKRRGQSGGGQSGGVRVSEPKVPEPERINAASALWTRAQVRDQRRAVQGVLPPRRPRLRRSMGPSPRPGGGSGVLSRRCLFVPEHATLRRVSIRSASHGVKLYVQTGLHHRRPGGADAPLSALRAKAWWIPRICSSTCRARRCSTVRCWPEDQERDLVKRVLDELERRVQGRGRRLRAPSGRTFWSRSSRRASTRTTTSASG